ncbi:chemotaxis protein CheB [Chlorobium phaeobacteroides]|uniref:protein-glutamate O-methyltransferase n=1 Tax=Chlorobium phaeobacteroides (strain DSM 266 / SMG 266 / 2430) TaxID=290317 RepID=A1BHC8_CHLPD|nr:chemotaxis protein CheB [Chlorobium phaeobacteroides]ABL65805.1 putative PAS/PAC sensor protein [Chlorobium phaeobacteroides DSM 266]
MKKTPNAKPQKIRHEEAVSMKAEKAFFPIVGIGASAGGLEALESFLKKVPFPCGISFVIVQHLDPTHKCILVELLQRVTSMPVVEVADRMKIEINHVYAIPPNKSMTILHGVLHLFDPTEPRGLRLPIDLFFRSLADDLQQHSIGVILSGMGSDGTLGLRTIKEKGGCVFVQDPKSAKFDGMPQSAIDAGLADIIAPVEDLPYRILAYLKHIPSIRQDNSHLEDKTLSGLEKIVLLLRRDTGQDFSLYKKNTLYRRIERRMGIHQIEKIADYVRFLQGNPHETTLLFKELLIGVTGFFRDPAAWETLKTRAIPTLLASRQADSTLRAWVAGCSTGEEAYSLAIAFIEAVELIRPRSDFRLRIFATDLDKDAIEKARSGIYPPNIASDLSKERLQRFFEQDEHGFRISKEIRETIVFAPHNIIMDPPFTKLDIITCRNLLIYMEQEIQKKLLPLFHYSLNPGGILFLGNAESIGSFSDLFDPLEVKTRLFRKLHKESQQDPVIFPAFFTHSENETSVIMNDRQKKPNPVVNLQSLADQIILQHYAPSAVLTNDRGDIIYISGRTGRYLEPAAGKANWNILAMAREGLRYELNLLFSSVLRTKQTSTKKGLCVGTNGGTQIVNVTIEPLEKPELLRRLLLIVFTPVEKSKSETSKDNPLHISSGNNILASLEEDLRVARDEIMTIREEMQTSQEELKSTNEEMQSANEELQSTNEELTTSKEEMQSLNEELQTVNHELQSKVSELSEANNDMKNLLNSTDIATLFLDDSLNIRRFTTRTASIIKLIASDIGRPITDIVTDLHYPALADDAQEVLRTLIFREKQVSANNDRWFSVKIMPYRTQENKIVGLVITFSDITTSKKLEACLRESEERFRFLFETMPEGALLQDSEGKILMANHEAERIFGLSSEAMKNKKTEELQRAFVQKDGSAFPPEKYPYLVALDSGKTCSGVVMGIMLPASQTCRWIKVSALPRFHENTEKPYQVYTTFVEITLPKGNHSE